MLGGGYAAVGQAPPVFLDHLHTRRGRSLYLLERLTGWAIPKARACSLPRADRFKRHLSCSKVLGAYGPRRRGAHGRCCGQMEWCISAEGRGLMSVVTHGNKHNSIIRRLAPFPSPPFSLPPLPYRTPYSLGAQNYRTK